MIQINLIPDIKQEYLKAKQMRNVAISISIVAGIAAVGVAVLLGILLGAQAIREALIDNSIKSEQSKFANYPDVNNILTIQNQLGKIDEINNSRVMGSRLFGLLEAVNPKAPNEVRFTSVRLTPKDKKMVIEGVAGNGYAAIESLKKTISNTNLEYKKGNDSLKTPLSSMAEVTESSYGEDGAGKRVVRFTMSVSYDENVFSNAVKDVKVVSPGGEVNVTDSRLRVPSSLFSAPAKDSTGGAQNGQ